MLPGFNSLQTGNCIQTGFQWQSHRGPEICFNSLQTGNCIQTLFKRLPQGRKGEVSIPFKRETAFKQNGWRNPMVVATIKVSIPFKRETAFKPGRNMESEDIPIEVSIPFKRETAFKPISRSRLEGTAATKFQFPSNGKLHSNLEIGSRKVFLSSIYVSIPFKRETAFKLRNRSGGQDSCDIFVSIPFKRETAFKLEFWQRDHHSAQLRIVSIPFKRETAFKLGTDGVDETVDNGLWSFNSLQTGNCIQTSDHCGNRGNRISHVSIPFKRETAFKLYHRRIYMILRRIVSIPFKRETAFKLVAGNVVSANTILFQFPSNGKLHSNQSIGTAPPSAGSFNSLQTGNCIQTRGQKSPDPTQESVKFQFPSNGKLHSNAWYAGLYWWWVSIRVSIPFKRETAFKRSLIAVSAVVIKLFQFPSNGKLHSNSERS